MSGRSSRIYSVDDPRFFHNDRDFLIELPGLIRKGARKYFFLPLTTNPDSPPFIDGTFFNKYRTVLSMLIPALIVHICWWVYMSVNSKFDLFVGELAGSEKPRFLLSITMLFGSLFAGATSEGGATISFPVLTLILGVHPLDARNFGFMIQSVGMSCAAFAIFFLNIKLEYHSLLYCTLGGALGVTTGLEFIMPLVSPAFTKMYFVSVWFAFAIALFWVCFIQKRWKVYEGIPYWEATHFPPALVFDFTAPRAQLGAMWGRIRTRVVGDSAIQSQQQQLDAPISTREARAPEAPTTQVRFHWKAATLFVTGFVGGIFSAMGGSGLDICCFSVLTLLFSVSERVATPTSIVLMSINSIVAFVWLRGVGGISSESWNLWLCCVPVVCIGAPLGAILMSRWHRLVISLLVVIVSVTQLAGALYVVQPWHDEHTNHPLELCLYSLLLMLFSGVVFVVMAWAGHVMVVSYTDLPFETRFVEEDRLRECNGDGNASANSIEMRPAGTAARAPPSPSPSWSWFAYDRRTLNNLAELNENSTGRLAVAKDENEASSQTSL
jgi:uncharacterized protein